MRQTVNGMLLSATLPWFPSTIIIPREPRVGESILVDIMTGPMQCQVTKIEGDNLHLTTESVLQSKDGPTNQIMRMYQVVEA